MSHNEEDCINCGEGIGVKDDRRTAEATYECRVCGCLWRLNGDSTWSLADGLQVAAECCDNNEELLSKLQKIRTCAVCDVRIPRADRICAKCEATGLHGKNHRPDKATGIPASTPEEDACMCPYDPEAKGLPCPVHPQRTSDAPPWKCGTCKTEIDEMAGHLFVTAEYGGPLHFCSDACARKSQACYGCHAAGPNIPTDPRHTRDAGCRVRRVSADATCDACGSPGAAERTCRDGSKFKVCATCEPKRVAAEARARCLQPDANDSACTCCQRRWFREDQARREGGYPDFGEIARATFDNYDGEITAEVLAHEIALAYEAGETHAGDRRRESDPTEYQLAIERANAHNLKKEIVALREALASVLAWDPPDGQEGVHQRALYVLAGHSSRDAQPDEATDTKEK